LLEYFLVKKITLTQGKFALIDDEDFERVNQYKWYVNGNRASRTIQIGYKDPTKPKNSSNQKKTHIMMHRFILNVSKNQEIDHKDGNGFNNQKSNLRACTSSQNKFNRKKRVSSIYKGIEYVLSYKHGKKYAREKPWMARTQMNGKRFFIGYYHTPIEAAKAYDLKARELFGEFAKTNF
jgi:hypothetical protein